MNLLPIAKTQNEMEIERESGRPLIISGPCSAETEKQLLETALGLARCGVGIFRAGIWKPRTKPGGFEGIGIPALRWMQHVKEATGMLTAVEVAKKEHVRAAMKAKIDILWIGARTTVNPFAVQEIADSLKGHDVTVLVKNPVNPDLELWIGAIERLHRAGIRRLGAIHRGYSPYEETVYRNLPIWRIPMELRRRLPGLPIICDPSHIAGRREYIEPLSREALELGFDGLMIESHCDPDNAWSDAAQQISPETLRGILERLCSCEGVRAGDDLADLRERIDCIDLQLLELLAKRMRISGAIGMFKKKHDLPIVQNARYGEILENRLKLGERMALRAGFVEGILKAIHEESVREQTVLAST